MILQQQPTADLHLRHQMSLQPFFKVHIRYQPAVLTESHPPMYRRINSHPHSHPGIHRTILSVDRNTSVPFAVIGLLENTMVFTGKFDSTSLNGYSNLFLSSVVQLRRMQRIFQKNCSKRPVLCLSGGKELYCR